MPATFNEKVYRLVQRIPTGKVSSYGRVAKLLGVPRGARAVGWALGHLNGRTDVPWHRVINRNGFISTPYVDQTAQEQRRRLEEEGITFDAEGQVDFSKFLWNPPIWEFEDLWDESRIV